MQSKVLYIGNFTAHTEQFESVVEFRTLSLFTVVCLKCAAAVACRAIPMEVGERNEKKRATKRIAKEQNDNIIQHFMCILQQCTHLSAREALS